MSDSGLFVFLMMILGGIGSMWGALLGSWFFVYANDKITNAKTSIGGHELREFRPIIFGIILILVMITLPDGIIGLGSKIRRLIRRDSRPIMPNWLALLLGLSRSPAAVAAGDGEVRPGVDLPGADAGKLPLGAPGDRSGRTVGELRWRARRRSTSRSPCTSTRSSV